MPTLEPAAPDFVNSASGSARTEVVIEASIDRCWQTLAEAATWTDWFPGMTGAESQPAVWTAVGDTRTVTVGGMKVDEEAIIIDPPHRWGFTILHWPLPIGSKAVEVVHLTDESSDGVPRTRLEYMVGVDLNRFGRLIWPLLRRRMVSGWRTGFTNLGPYLKAK